MLQKLASHNPDIKQLLEKGHALATDEGYLIVRDIPYLDDKGELQIGAFVTKLVYKTDDEVEQEDHQVFFAGGIPHSLDGTAIRNLGGGQTTLALSKNSSDVVVQRSFSNKPQPEGKFENFFAKIESYTRIIAGPAMEKHGANPYTFRCIEEVPDSVFKHRDTLSSRAEIGDLSAKFADEVVAIIGLGGTGSYVLDFVAKTPVREIRGFDDDLYYVHNAFRSPGKLEVDELGLPKADVYQHRYEGFRHGVSLVAKRIGESSGSLLEGVTFAFVCVDKGSSRKEIFKLLMSLGIPFIDVGMGLDRADEGLRGMVRMTYFSPEHGAEMLDRKVVPTDDDPEGEYKVTIQTSELNALNACMAVIRYKQLRGFYVGAGAPDHALATTTNLKITGEVSLQ